MQSTETKKWLAVCSLTALVLAPLAPAEATSGAEPEKEPAALENRTQVVIDGVEYRPVRAVPEIPVILDGVTVAPEELSALVGDEPLVFYLDQQAIDEGVIHAFTSLDRFQKPSDGAPGAEVPGKWVYEAEFHKNTMFYGGVLNIPPPGQIADLRYTSQGNFNNQISSLTTVGLGWGCTFLYDRFDFDPGSGNSQDLLIVAPGVAISNLGVYGWNNKISSIQVGPPSLGCGGF